jgi:hypothetical protein
MKSKKKFPAGVKVLASLLCVVAVAFVTLALGEDGEVQQADADIFDLFTFTSRSSSGFEDVLAEMGHDAPQTFEINGNVMHVSVRHVRQSSVRTVVRDYQRMLFEKGVNDREYTRTGKIANGIGSKETSRRRLMTSLRGGLVPMVIERDYARMDGVTMEADPETDIGVFRALLDKHEDENPFNGFRRIEMFRPPNSDRLTVLGIWSDDKFDYQKMLPDGKHLGDPSLNEENPICPGCQRVHHFKDLTRVEREHGTTVFVGRQSVEQLVSFYQLEFMGRGWKYLEKNAKSHKVQQEVALEYPRSRTLRFERDDEELEILVFPSTEQETAVHVTKNKKSIL